MDDDVVLNVHITTNQSFEWIDHSGWRLGTSAEDVVDMGAWHSRRNRGVMSLAKQ